MASKDTTTPPKAARGRRTPPPTPPEAGDTHSPPGGEGETVDVGNGASPASEAADAAAAGEVSLRNMMGALWNDETARALADHWKTVKRADEERAELNALRAKINAKVKSSLEALIDRGFERHGIKAGIEFLKLVERAKEGTDKGKPNPSNGFDLSFLAIRQAAQNPVQRDMFELIAGEPAKGPKH